ncbi:unnamed protein product [Cuscuta campestris]|uniref:Kinesin motor domain-containing protein n=1 Tax=Cuscuta campestris TaxID=132261 RepID=A0A484KM39_9ASTE|nr:unnamed protein product [Cuscuta campestris]
MLRDFRFLRRNSGKNLQLEERENVPVNPDALAGSQVTNPDSSRPPLHAVQEKSAADQEAGAAARVAKLARGRNDTVPERDMTDQGGVRVSKIDRTPTKPKHSRYFDSTTPLRTPLRVDGSSTHGAPSRTMANMGTPRSTRKAARTNSECNSTQSTPMKSVSKPPNPPVSCLTNGSRPPVNGGVRMTNYEALSKGVPTSSNSLAVVNTIDVPHFALKEDPSFWMEHNVQVLIRVRPLNSMEKSSNGYNRCLKQESAQCIAWIGHPETRFTFDHVACESLDQETLFRMAGLPMVENCLSGYNSCIFAYGQTGSGKTYTMLGEIEELEFRPSPHRGMTPRIFEFLFARMRLEEESRREERLKYSCKCSFLEIYNEQVTDLLDPSSTNLMLREDITKGVYVENLSEFEVQTVGDIIKLLSQGSSNRRVAATNMNRESSRSHSVFTCVIESSWEKDSTTNFRFARLNLVDLAGSERQKTSGAEGERLKEAANINKSLSTLGHVIMVLVDIAHGRPRHIPYRDSRLTYLLQDSLGGNSKTMMIANVSPSICCAAETLNTLKFAQRAKLIQNNAVVNEDSSADTLALQHQIRLLKEELSTLKRQKTPNISRTLSFDTAGTGDRRHEESKSIPPESAKELKSMEATLAGALRREQMVESSIKHFEAEIEQLNRLVCQREEDTRCTKMMLKFREEKIHRMESLLNGLIPSDTYLLEENCALSEELNLIRANVDKNPEVTRFALENIRLLEHLRRFQDFYEEGERNLLLAEVSELRDQLLLSLDGKLKLHNPSDIDTSSQESAHIKQEETDSLHTELKETLSQLEECRSKLNSCLEKNAELRREINDLHASLGERESSVLDNDNGVEVIKESISEAPPLNYQSVVIAQEEKPDIGCDKMINLSDKIIDLQLELDILKILLHEEKSSHNEAEERALSLNRDLESTKDQILLLSKQYKDVQDELKEAKSIIEALESQQIQAINEAEDLRNSNKCYEELLQKKEHEISSLKEKGFSQDLPSFNVMESEYNPLQAKLKKMENSLEKARTLNTWYQSDQALQVSNEEEMDVIRRQVEAETAEVILCLQEELCLLQQEIQASHLKEVESYDRLNQLELRNKELEGKNNLITEDNRLLRGAYTEKEREYQSLLEEWEQVNNDMETILCGGQASLKDASDDLDLIASSFPQKQANRISNHFGSIAKYIFEKDKLIEDLNRNLRDVVNKRNDVESMLRSLRGAALVMTEVHQQQCSEKDVEIALLTAQLNSKMNAILEFKNKIKQLEGQLRETCTCATAAFLVVNRLSEANMQKEKFFEETCSGLRLELLEQQRHASAMQQKLEELEANDLMETLEEFKAGVSVVNSCMNEQVERQARLERENLSDGLQHMSIREACEIWTFADAKQHDDSGKDLETEHNKCSSQTHKILAGGERALNGTNGRDVTIALLKKEIVSALDSLKQVQAEISTSCIEKEEFRKAEKHTRDSVKSLVLPISALETSIGNFEGVVKLKLEEADAKLQQIELDVEEYRTSWLEQKELLEVELEDARAIAVQKTMEASYILAKYVEVQDTMTDTIVTIRELMRENEALKVDNKELKEKEVTLTNQRDFVVNENQCLQSANNLKDSHIEKMEKDFQMVTKQVMELEGIVSQVNSFGMEEFVSVASDFFNVKSDFHAASELMRSWIEDIWSEIIVKDFALSIFNLCHSGILLEAVNGLNAEKGLLHHGLCESNSAITELRDHNSKAKKELEMCRILQGKLLDDITSNFDRISKKEDETGDFTLKLATFEKRIIDLQSQEELMLRRSDHLGSKLAELVNEMDLSNQTVLASLLDRERLLQEKEEALKYSEDAFIMKDFEVFILSIKLQEMTAFIFNLERTYRSNFDTSEKMKMEIVLKNLGAAINESVLVDRETEVSVLKGIVEEAGKQQQKLLLELNEKTSIVAQLRDKNTSLEEEVHSLKDIACSNETLKSKLVEIDGTNFSLQTQVQSLNSELEKVKEEMHIKDSNLEISSSQLSDVCKQNQMLENRILSLEEASCRLQKELEMKHTELTEMNCLGNENNELQVELIGWKVENGELLQDLEVLRAELDRSNRAFSLLSKKSDELESSFQKICNVVDSVPMLLEEFELLENLAEEIVSQNLTLGNELSRKDDILKGLLFDLSLLQESASNTKDKKDEIEKLVSSLNALERELELKSCELDDTLSKSFKLEAQLLENKSTISALESDVLRQKNELCEMGSAISEMNNSIESLRRELSHVTCEKEDLNVELVALKKELEIAKALADENEAGSLEAKELAETRKLYAEEKDEEVKLLERSIEELECTVNVLENKVDIVKEEAERQCLQREELEMELHSIKQQMLSVKSSDNTDVKRNSIEKEKNLLQRIQILEKEVALRDVEITQCKVHISELNLHSEAQAREYKEKFKTLEAMAEKVKSDVHASIQGSNSSSSSSSKLEKNSLTKPKGSGSPFKCIGIGLGQQLKSERDEELTAERFRIEELEALAASRQKEIFMLNSRLAAAESMTHDVIRDLLGLKLDMNKYGTLLDNHEVQMLTEKAQAQKVDALAKEEEVTKLKQQLNEIIEERKGWLEEVERKQTQMMAAKVSLEKLHERDQLLATENEVIKRENMNHKKRVIELEAEVKKLSGQQNLQQRIHHHAKIKEENNLLKNQNDDLTFKLRKSEAILSRVREELAHFRASNNGRIPYINLDDENRMETKLKDRMNSERLTEMMPHVASSGRRSSIKADDENGQNPSRASSSQTPLYLTALHR